MNGLEKVTEATKHAIWDLDSRETHYFRSQSTLRIFLEKRLQEYFLTWRLWAKEHFHPRRFLPKIRD